MGADVATQRLRCVKWVEMRLAMRLDWHGPGMPYKGVCTFKVSGSHWSVGALLTAYTLTSLSVMRAVLGVCCVWEWRGGGTASENQSCKQQGATKQWWRGKGMSTLVFGNITLGKAGSMKEGRMIECKNSQQVTSVVWVGLGTCLPPPASPVLPELVT